MSLKLSWFPLMPYFKSFSNPRENVDPKRLRERMVKEQIEARGITSPAVLAAMRAVPRHLFVQEALRSQAYADTPLPIGHGQTISQPYIVALMSSLLDVSPGMRVLEIGTGSGYQAAILSRLGCLVHTVERIHELARSAAETMRRLDIRNVRIKECDGTLGMPEVPPFDRIIVTAGGPEVPPPLLEQLKDPGIMLIPVGERRRMQRLLRIRKESGKIFKKDMGDVVFVDLLGDYGWKDVYQDSGE